MRRAATALAVALAVGGGLGALGGCSGEARTPPNVLWVVWDTVRADRLALYGGAAAAAPELTRWARGARVFDDCLAVAPTTVPSHAAMFTGLLPAQHGATNARPWLADGHETLAERLRAAGYRTYLWSANPHIAHGTNFSQGFERTEHPWSAATRARALAHVGEKARGDRASGLAEELAAPQLLAWSVKESGTLAQERLLAWLGEREGRRPWFAFLNYMEAHRPLAPERRHREALMSAEQVARSYVFDHGWRASWEYTFGLREFAPEDLAALRGTYDAALAELDELFARLLAALEERGELDDTVVILTADHGEMLGEHHLLDHQYTLHAPVLHVPLAIHYPQRFTPGRDASPVTNADLFATVLELVGLPVPAALPSASLLTRRASRPRLAEYPEPFEAPLRDVARLHPDWDPAPWRRRLRALVAGDRKLVWSSDGRHALYDLARDPGERRDLFGRDPAQARRMLGELDALVESLAAVHAAREPAPPLSREDRTRLEALGYGAAEAPAE